MVNPALDQLNQNRVNQALGPIKNMLNQLQAVQNPQALLQQMLQSNPNMQRAIDFVNQNGGDAKQTCYSMLSQLGLDPDTVMKQLFSK